MRRLLALVAKVAISVLLLYVAFARVDLSTVVIRLQHANLAWLIALVAVLLTQLVLVAQRWRLIALQCAVPIPAANALRYMLVASFFNQTLPSTIGGDAARIWFVARTGAGWKSATYSVIVDRIIGLAVLVAIVVVCLPWLFELVHDPLGRTSILAINGAGIVAILVFLILGRIRWRRLERWWIARHIAGIAATAFRVLSDRLNLGAVVGLSIAVHLLTITAAWCAANAADAPLAFGHALLLIPPVILVAAIPISIAGWGVREGAMMAVFTYAGLPDVDGLIVSVLYGTGQFAVGAIGGVIWILGSDRKTWAADQSAPRSRN